LARIALISGSPGARGEAIAAELARRGWEVRPALYAGGAVPDLVAAARGAELLVHLGVRTPADAGTAWRLQAEVEAARAAGEASRAAGVRRFLLVSTASVYGRPRHLPCEEGELKRPRTAAERARWEAERAAWRTCRDGAPLTVLRPTILYGPGMRGGVIRALSFLVLLSRGRRSVPILRRGPVAHLLHVEDLARAVACVAEHPDDRAVLGRAFNVGDDAPLPLAEHLAAALEALGYRPGRYLPYSPRLTAALLWLVRHLPDRLLFAPANARLASAWGRYATSSGASGALSPRVDRAALHWMAADHYYDTRRLTALGWRPLHPLSTQALPATIRALVAAHHLPGAAAIERS